MRKSGILLHISSLPNKDGIGTLGNKAYEFVDFLVKAKKRYWQVLPIGPTSYGDSPYQSFSAFAGNPYFIELDILKEVNLLPFLKQDDQVNKNEQIDYAFLYQTRYIVLQKSYQHFLNSPNHPYVEEFIEFKNDQQNWLLEYALFMSLKKEHEDLPWWKWPNEYKFRDHSALEKFIVHHQQEIDFWCYLQFLFFKQWFNLKNYANNKGIKIIGDLPIYVARDSSDMWVEPTMWLVDKTLEPTIVAGCPPDYFAPLGQLWGNPIYNYRKMKKNNYQWWIKRIEQSFKLFDTVRIDHFRGFAGYYAIEAKHLDATNGKWYKGPGFSLFKIIKRQLGDLDIIAEDLGFLTDDVHKLLAKTKYPGMKILQFAFDPYGDSIYLPHHITYNMVVYPGTHDNMTIKQWYQTLAPEFFQM